jgi:hypothetical protein
MGTHLFFEKDESVQIDPLYTRCNNFYKFANKTNKIAKLNRVLLKDMEDEAGGSQKDQDSESNSLKIMRTYGEALNLFLRSGKKPPRAVSKEDERLSLEILRQQLEEDVKEEEELTKMEEVDFENMTIE